MKVVSWNVNGLRAVYKKGAWQEFLEKLPADVYCIQETKARPEQLPDELVNIEGYESYFNYHRKKKGYAGVALYIKKDFKTQEIIENFNENFDDDGRVIGAKFKEFTLLNVYFPNGGAGPEALEHKLEFYDAFLEFVSALKQSGESVLIAGDFNVAHEEIDLARPKENENSVGFLPEERAWFDALLAEGFVDLWRELNPEKVAYTWWSQRTRARERNVGWRIDYFVATADLLEKVVDVKIDDEILGSDHCPISLKLDI